MNSLVTALWIILAITGVDLGLIAWCVITGNPIPAVVMTLLGVVLGFLGGHLASAQGASQALVMPPQQPPMVVQVPSAQPAQAQPAPVKPTEVVNPPATNI